MDLNPPVKPAINPKKPLNKKKLLVVVIILFLVILLIALAAIAISKKSSNKQNGSAGNADSNQSSKDKTATNYNHPQFYFATLEYNEASKSAVALKTGTSNGDTPHYFPNKPVVQSSSFEYKVVVISDKNEILQTGWNFISKEIIKTKNNTLIFNVATIYKKNATVIVSLPSNQIIWSGKIP